MTRQTPESLRSRRRTTRRAAPPIEEVATAAVAPSNGRVDVLLMRAAYIAQVVVTIATIVGFFYTVIPLYQKAAVDELIARREAELKIAEESLATAQREAYAQHRLNFVERFSRTAANDCSDVLRDIMTPVAHFPQSPEERAVRHAEVLKLEIDVSRCLAGEIESNRAPTILSRSDLAYLDSRARDLGAKCNQDRNSAAQQIADLPVLSSTNPALLDSPGDATKYINDLQDKAALELHQPLSEAQLRARHVDAVGRTQERIARDYRQRCFQTLLDAFRQVEWPAPSSGVSPASTQSHPASS
jgi:hypothetical protein